MAYLRKSQVTGLSPRGIDLNTITTPAGARINGRITSHTLKMADTFTVVDDITISDNLILAKVSDDGDDLILTSDNVSDRTIEGSGSIEGSTIAQTPNASLTGMTGVVGSAVTGSPALNLGNSTFPVGHILQVKSTTLTTAFTGTSGWSDITGMAVSITPSSTSNKILIFVSINVTASNDSWVRLMRDSTSIAIGTGQASNQIQSTLGYMYSGSGGFVETRSMNFLDSPSSTSAISYNLEYNSIATIFVNRSSNDNNTSARGRHVSTITAMEIKG